MEPLSELPPPADDSLAPSNQNTTEQQTAVDGSDAPQASSNDITTSSPGHIAMEAIDDKNDDAKVELWIDRTNQPLGEIGNDYDLTTTLQILCLTNNRIKKIERLQPCINLTDLILRQNSITVLEGLDTLHNLMDLDLYMNAITEIPSTAFAPNPKLKRLDLSFNQLRSLDHFPSDHLQNLEELYLIGNKIRRITALQHMPKLQMLELGDNRIRQIENLHHLTSLQSLWLGRNKITHISNLDALSQLKKLSLQSNRITVIEHLSHLVHLEELYLSHNGLKSMSGVEQLRNLRLLDLGANEIEHIVGLADLTLLTEFWFNDNQLASFDDLSHLQHATAIETVYLEGNPLARDPQYQAKALQLLPPSLEQLDAMLVSYVRLDLERNSEALRRDGENPSNALPNLPDG